MRIFLITILILFSLASYADEKKALKLLEKGEYEKLIESLDKDALTVQYGHFDYIVGSGILLADGNSDGGERGGWWLGARRTFRNSFLTTLQSGKWKAEGFYLEN